MISYEKIIEEISGNGRYQALLIFMGIYTFVTGAFFSTGPVFLAGLPESHCNIVVFDNDTLPSNETTKDAFIPWNNITQNYDRCSRYAYNLTACEQNRTLECYHEKAVDGKEESCIDGYYFDRTTSYVETVTTEWNLVCDRLSLKSMATSSYYAGMLIGALVAGVLADRFGRVLMYRVSGILTLACGVAVAFSPNIFAYSFVRMVLAITQLLGSVSSFVYASEISKQSWRSMMGSVFNGIFGLGCVAVAGMAYYWRTWQELSVVFAIGSAPVVIFSFFLQKSPRWLLTKGKKEEAKKVCSIMAKRNGATLDDKLLDDNCLLSSISNEENANNSKFSLKELLVRPYSRYMIISNCFVWAITSLVYFGLMLNSGEISGNVYVNHALGGIMEFSACLVCIPLIWKIGRQKTTSWGLAISSLSCLLSTVVIQTGRGNTSLETLGIVLAMIGRFCSSGAFAVIYQHTVELFPTCGRGTALGVSSMAARIGSVLTPFTLQIQYDIPWLTPTIFGITAMLAAMLASTFPETKGKPLLTSFDEGEDFFRNHLEGSLVSRLCCLPQKREGKFNEHTLNDSPKE